MKPLSLLIQPHARLAVAVFGALISCVAQAGTISISGYDDVFKPISTKSIEIISPARTIFPDAGISLALRGEGAQLLRSDSKYALHQESSRYGMMHGDKWGDAFGDTRANIKFANFGGFRPGISDNESDHERSWHFDNERWRDVSVKHSNSMFRLFYPAVIVIVSNHGGKYSSHNQHKPDRPDIQLPGQGTPGGDYCELPKPVPLPAAVWLFGSGIAALGALGRRRKAIAAA